MLISTLQSGPGTPFGGVLAARSGSGVAFLAFGDDAAALERSLVERFPDATIDHRDDDPELLRAVDAARRYVELAAPGSERGEGNAAEGLFDSIPVDLSRGTEFQRRVWGALRQIPYGETRSYGQIAESIGMTRNASRAVGAACGANPIALVVPCHRAIGASGDLVGFAWGGVEMKRRLLEMESGERMLFSGR